MLDAKTTLDMYDALVDAKCTIEEYADDHAATDVTTLLPRLRDIVYRIGQAGVIEDLKREVSNA